MTATYRSHTSSTGTDATAEGTIPAGSTTGDFMVAFLMSGGSGTTVTVVPTGWALEVADPNPTDFSCWCYTKAWAASEPAPTWTLSASGTWTLDIITYSGVNTGAAVNAEIGEQIAAANTITLGPVTPNVDDCTLIGWAGLDASGGARTWTQTDTPSERFDQLNNAHHRSAADWALAGGSGVGVSRGFTATGSAQDLGGFLLALAPLISTTGAAVGAFGFTASAAGVPATLGAAVASFGFTGEASGTTGGGGVAIALRSTSTSGSGDTLSSSKTVPVPTGAAIDDIALITVETWTSSAEPTVTWPSGFAEITGAHASEATPGSGGQQSIRKAWKRLTAADTGNYSLTFSATTWNMAHCEMYSGGLASGDPIEASNTATATTGYPSTSVTVATLAALSNTAATFQAVTTTAPTNWTEQQDTNVLHTNTRILTGTGSFTASGGTVSGNGEICVAMVAIKPASGATTVNGLAVGSFGFTASSQGIPRTSGATSAALGFTGSAAGVDRALGVATAALGFAAIGAGVDRALGQATAVLGFTGSAAGAVGTPPVTGQALAVFGFTATATGVPRTAGVAAGSFGFTGSASGVDRAVGAAAAVLGFVGAAQGVDRSVAAATTAFGFTGTGAGVLEVFGIAAAVLGFTGAAQGFAGTPPVTGSAVAAFGFTGAAQAHPGKLGGATATLMFVATASGNPRTQGAAAAAFAFTGSAAGERSVLGVGQAPFGFTAVANGQGATLNAQSVATVTARYESTATVAARASSTSQVTN